MDDQKPVSDWTTDFNIFDAEYTKDPSPVWNDLRERCPMAHTDRFGGMWMATRYEDVQALVRKVPELSNRQPSLSPMRPEADLLADYHAHMLPPISADPPEQIPQRRLILPFFTPKAVELHRPFTVKLCNDLIDGFIDKGEADGAADYAQQITPRVIAHMLGIDTTRADQFVEWVRGFVEFGVADIELRSRSRRDIMNFFAEEVAARRARPSDDYISQLLLKELDGVPLTDAMVINMCLLLLTAGIDTTWSSIGTSLWHFATHPDDRRRLAGEPDLWPTAIEEMLRLHAPVSIARIAMEDVEHDDTNFARGDRLMLNLPAANRDPDVFECPDEAVLDRRKNRHVAFGIGIHRCAGSNLARMEMEVALQTWFERIPEFELTDPDAVTWAAGQVRGARNVPVRF